MPTLVFLSAYYCCCGFISTLWKVDNKNHSIQFCIIKSIIFRHPTPNDAVGAPRLVRYPEKTANFCVLTTGFANVDVNITVIKLFLNRCASKLGEENSKLHPASRAFPLIELENCMNWVRPLLSNVWHVARISFPSPEPVDSWSRGLRYKLSRVALRTGIPPGPNSCALSTAGSVMTIGLSINRCEHSKPQFYEKILEWLV